MLEQLLVGAIEDAQKRQQTASLASVEAAALSAPAPIDALSFLAPSERVKVIAEIKRSSPSKGALADIVDPQALARDYEAGGASAVSVLTEGRRFGGSLDDLRAVRAAIDIPVLRKDFIGLEYQVFEARAAGADLVLLIVAALDQKTLARLHALITELGMTALVETHSADELNRAIDLGSRVIGVNARNLTTFELDPDLFGRLADSIPDGTIRIAESAVKTAADVAHYRRSGADVVLIGEALVTHGSPRETLTEFLSVNP